jgi:hypothetical protein
MEDDVMAEIAPIDEVLRILRGYDRGIYTDQEVVVRLVLAAASCPTAVLAELLSDDWIEAIRKRVTPVPEGLTVWIWGDLLKPGVDPGAHEAEMRRLWDEGASNWRAHLASGPLS